jgi:PLP dependent protein
MARQYSGLDPERVKRNADAVRARIAAAAARVNRDPADVDLLAAVKYVPLEELGVLRAAGIDLLGENRAQDLVAKAQNFPEYRWHFIGQLQSRKVKLIAPHAQLIHSVDSESALEQLGRHALPQTEILIQVNVAREADKAGVAPDEVGDFVQASPVPVVGLATMPPFTEDPQASREPFAALRELARAHGLHHLSMGTSQDFEVAVEEGATIVRVGSTLYGT